MWDYSDKLKNTSSIRGCELSSTNHYPCGMAASMGATTKPSRGQYDRALAMLFLLED